MFRMFQKFGWNITEPIQSKIPFGLTNFMRNNFDCDFRNLCDSQMLRKLFRPKAAVHWDIIEKDTVDEILYFLEDVSIKDLRVQEIVHFQCFEVCCI
jgi:hypothetical protein